MKSFIPTIAVLSLLYVGGTPLSHAEETLEPIQQEQAQQEPQQQTQSKPAAKTSDKPAYNLQAKSVYDMNQLSAEERKNIVEVSPERIDAYIKVMFEITAMQDDFERTSNYQDITNPIEKKRAIAGFYHKVDEYLKKVGSPLDVREYYVITYAARNYPPIGGQIQAAYKAQKKEMHKGLRKTSNLPPEQQKFYFESLRAQREDAQTRAVDANRENNEITPMSGD